MVTRIRNLYPTNRGSIAGMENVYFFYKIPSGFGFESRWGQKNFFSPHSSIPALGGLARG